jgi:hypothetical protein
MASAHWEPGLGSGGVLRRLRRESVRRKYEPLSEDSIPSERKTRVRTLAGTTLDDLKRVGDLYAVTVTPPGRVVTLSWSELTHLGAFKKAVKRQTGVRARVPSAHWLKTVEFLFGRKV